MALSGDSRTHAQTDPARFGVMHVPPPYAYRCPYGTASPQECGARSVAEVSRLFDQHGAGNFAAVIMEPNAGTNGIVAPENYWPGLRELTRARNVYLIADEIMSGFGRCGEWFAWQRYGDAGKPDLMTLAKGLTGAHIPLGAVVVAAPVARLLETQMLYTGLTYCGHPLVVRSRRRSNARLRGCKLIERSRRLGARMFAALQALQHYHPSIGDVRGGDGLFAVVELVRDRATARTLAPWPQDTAGATPLSTARATPAFRSPRAAT
jgi:taurine--2-oxoglutarate transaminase